MSGEMPDALYHEFEDSVHSLGIIGKTRFYLGAGLMIGGMKVLPYPIRQMVTRGMVWEDRQDNKRGFE